MRLWSISPAYLDSKGLVALWREGLLAQKVLLGLTRGYAHHPQLVRFRATTDPVLYIGTYLYYVAQEGLRRGYRFDLSKVVRYDVGAPRVPVTTGQLRFEMCHLLSKLRARDPLRYEVLVRVRDVEPHPIFYAVTGDVESWERSRAGSKVIGAPCP